MGTGPRSPAARLLGFDREKAPCAATLHRVFKDLDVTAFEAAPGDALLTQRAMGRFDRTSNRCSGWSGGGQ